MVPFVVWRNSGAVRHVTGGECDRLRIERQSEEAIRTSLIAGEVPDRAGVQSSLRRQFGQKANGAPACAFRAHPVSDSDNIRSVIPI
nr:DUF4172 domain-containing protein [Rhodovulum strictum]